MKNVEVSKKFYGELFGQTVTLDLGWNITFSGGFAIQQNFGWLCDIPENAIVPKSNNMELYFEVDNFDEFLNKLESYPDINYVNRPENARMRNSVLCGFMTPIIISLKIGESMAVIARRYLAEGYSVAETAEIIRHPVAVCGGG